MQSMYQISSITDNRDGTTSVGVMNDTKFYKVLTDTVHLMAFQNPSSYVLHVEGLEVSIVPKPHDYR